MTRPLTSLPFENRWTNGEHARHWYLQLEREGLESVKLRHAFQATQASPGDDDPSIPADFVAAWLAYHARREARRRSGWRSSVLILLIVAAASAIIAASYGYRLYQEWSETNDVDRTREH